MSERRKLATRIFRDMVVAQQLDFPLDNLFHLGVRKDEHGHLINSYSLRSPVFRFPTGLELPPRIDTKLSERWGAFSKNLAILTDPVFPKRRLDLPTVENARKAFLNAVSIAEMLKSLRVQPEIYLPECIEFAPGLSYHKVYGVEEIKGPKHQLEAELGVIVWYPPTLQEIKWKNRSNTNKHDASLLTTEFTLIIAAIKGGKKRSFHIPLNSNEFDIPSSSSMS